MAGKSTRKATASTGESTPGGGLTEKKARFVVEYLKDFNATQAAIRAGYSEKTAGSAGWRLLKDVAIQRAIAPKREEAVIERAEAINRMVLSAERTRLEIARIAYFDPRKLFDKNGRPLAITELDDDTAAVVAGLDVFEERDSEGMVIGHVKKWKIASKVEALEKAAKIGGLYELDNNQLRPLTQVVVVPAKEPAP